MWLLYDLAIWLYGGVLRLAAYFNRSAREWIDGRRGLFENLDLQIPGDKPVIWFHASSLGEFDQGRVLLEKARHEFPNHFILVSFFSPSGYKIRKHYPSADYVCYLPLDKPSNVNRFLDIVNPTLVVWVKYDFWGRFLLALKKRNIPTYLIAGKFRSSQFFFKWYGTFFKEALGAFAQMFVQDEASKNILNEARFEEVVVAGDPRIDWVLHNASKRKEIKNIKAFAENQRLLIAGSTHPADTDVLHTYFEENPNFLLDYKFILAPHHVNQSNIRKLEKQFEAYNPVLFSAWNEAPNPEDRFIIIDNIGLLISLYQYGTFAYIGGAFKTGLHNILEPASFGLPIIFGPNYDKFDEAVSLIKDKGAISISDLETCTLAFEKLMLETSRREMVQVVRNYMRNNVGASAQIWPILKSKLKTKN